MYDWVKNDLQNFGKYYSENNEIRDLSNKEIDIAFIGSGLSSTFTLIEYINQLEEIPSLKTSNSNDLVRIMMFEKDSWLWGGIPYGRRSGFTSLIITPLNEFLPESELNVFIDWMSENIDWLIVPFKQNAGNRSKKWLEDCEEKIKSKKSARIHIPRYFFGIYLWEKLKNACSASNKSIKLDFINAEVSSIKKNEVGSFSLCVNGDIAFSANQILLGIGIPQIRSLGEINTKLNDIVFLKDPYFPDLESSINMIYDYVKKRESSKILVVGANASALELIYQITNYIDVDKNNLHFTVMSPQGKLPDLFIKDKQTKFKADSLNKLSISANEITADMILNALKYDLDYADKNNFNISDTLPIFTNHVGGLVQRLSKKEKQKFISFHGLEIGRLQRRAGLEYTQPIEELSLTNKLDVIKGKFINFSKDIDMTKVLFKKDNAGETQMRRYDVVINCAGSSGLTKAGMSPLLKQLIESGLCSSTPSNHGIEVGDNFEVMPGFYINGPLLAGNVVGEMGIWHVEHCGRIIGFSKKIAANILDEVNPI
tara:strand:- start:2842 stop:4464 length:1623 start_codon:yes stop_codon:yes gene_type:complete